MAATGTPTPNIGLRRPQGTDPASVDDINYNSNLIDTKLGAVGNTSVQEQINSLNSNLTGALSPAISGGTVVDDTLYKVGNTVWASARHHGISTPANGVFFTIPNGFRPKRHTYVYAYMVVDNTFIPTFGAVDAEGNVFLSYTSSKTTTQVFFAGSWSVL